MASQTEYVLGTHDEEIRRLGVQHAAWRANALAAWRTAGIGPRHTVLDVGCGPGYCALDLASLVGMDGRVVAIDKSERFLCELDRMRDERRLANITAHRADLDAGEFPGISADSAWCRWVLTFTRHPRAVLERIAAALKPGGVLVLHEYFDYAAWRGAPHCDELETFVEAVMRSWRESGGEPDVGLNLPAWLTELGFELHKVRPIVEAVRPGDPKWGWLRAFVEGNRRRLIELGYLGEGEAAEIWRAWEELEKANPAWMITPGLLEIIARLNP